MRSPRDPNRLPSGSAAPPAGQHAAAPLSRRAFLTAGAGAAALALSGATRAGAAHGSAVDAGPLRDYVGRLCFNENPLGPSPLARQAMIEAADLGHRYGDWYAESLRDDIAAEHGLTRGHVLAGCGCTEVLRLCALALAEPGRNVVCPSPSYSQFPSDCQFLGAEVRYVDLDENWRVDLGALAAQVDADTAAVCITNPNNPTATVVGAADLEAFVATLPEGTALIVDEAYHEYVHDPAYASAVGLVQQELPVIVLRTFSKVFGLAGVRIGYAVATPGMLGGLSAWHLWATVSRLGIAAARAALGDAQHIQDTVALADATKAYCFAQFDQWGFPYVPSETNFFLVDVENGPSVASALADRGIHVRTGWGLPRHIRVSTGTMEEMEAFILALQEIFFGQGASPSGPRFSAFHGAFPNLIREGTSLRYAANGADGVVFELFDVRGRLLRAWRPGLVAAGQHDLRWDGRDAAGRRLPAGTYFCRFSAGTQERVRRVVILP